MKIIFDSVLLFSVEILMLLDLFTACYEVLKISVTQILKRDIVL